MKRFEKARLQSPDPATGLPYRWTVRFEDGRQVPWTGLQTGPLTFSREQIERLCEKLLGFGIDRLEGHADRVLKPATGAMAERPALILHSTTPDLKTFDGDLDALVRGGPGGDFTTYKEARSVYLASPGDVVVGRTRAWKSAVEALGPEAIELEDIDHYYLSHALLHLARKRRPGTDSAIERLIACVRNTPRVIRLYAFELEMQIFLLWLAAAAGLEELALEANRPAISAAWNRKAVLHPKVEQAAAWEVPNTSPARLLEMESRHCELATRMELEVPRLPGYTIERAGRSVEDFMRQLLLAADLLATRYGLEHGCLKASESGDGARIRPGIPLADHTMLSDLGRAAHVHGDEYVLEAHVHYCQAEIAGQILPAALSAHIRGGRLAPGATAQFMEGTSWKGNVLLDERSLELFSVPAEHYRRLRRFVDAFRDAFERRMPGLVLAGVDFAVGTVGGTFGEEPLLGVQDLNVSFTGAECLRAFLEKAQRARYEASERREVGAPGADVEQLYGVTRIYRPTAHADHSAFLRVTRRFLTATVYADTVASIPGRWGMVGITGTDPLNAIENLNRLERSLVLDGLVQPQTGSEGIR